ncbi:sensor histidine kinase [Naasia lichenicola]|nr:sensor histidine kinase [Naasia lichenicola]
MGPGPGFGRGMSPTTRLWLPTVLCLLVLVPFSVFQAVRSDGRLALLGVAVAVVGSLGLLVRRRHPGPTVAGLALLTVLGMVVTPMAGGSPVGPPPIALAIAVVSAIVHGARTWALISLATAWLAALAVGLLGAELWSPGRIIWTSVFVLLAVGIGEFRRTRSERYASFRRIQQQRRDEAEQTERLRIARELHDVLSHSLSSIAVQAGVGLHLIDSHPERAAEALANIRIASTSALDEVRSVIGVLRADGHAPLRPAPDLSGLPELIGTAEASGLEVALNNGIVSDLPASIQLAIYRIVQESLTNVVRHAEASSVTITLREGGGAVEVTVDDDGRGASVAIAGGAPRTGVRTMDDLGTIGPVAGGGAGFNAGGRGLLGMRERAELQGGEFAAGARPGGGYRVTATLPVHESASR